MNDLVFSVSELNNYVKNILDSEPNLQNIFLMGEISNCTFSRPGHIYMTIKDEDASIKAVMFSYAAKRLKVTPKNGMQVLALGKASLYERDGSYQFYIEELRENGEGNLSVLFEKLKEKLMEEGLFDEKNKKPIPQFPKKIGVITSKTGAAIQDIFSVLGRRYPIAEVVFFDSKVQGEDADTTLANGVRVLSQTDCDVIIIGRGGGSMEDLWQFNSEKLAREIHASKIPIISAVGHETDFTICDFAADLRAPTPSAAAELSTPSVTEIADELSQLESLLKGKINSKLYSFERRLNQIEKKEIWSASGNILKMKQEKIREIQIKINAAVNDKLGKSKNKFAVVTAKIQSLSPLRTIARGYAVAECGGQIIKSKNDVTVGAEIGIRLTDGKLHCEVKEVE